MHIEAMPYADQLSVHADEIENRTKNWSWEDDTPIRLEISIVYSAVIIRKLWEHYAELFREVGFDLERPMSGLNELGVASQQTGLTFVHRIVHSKFIDTSEHTQTTGVQFESDRKGRLKIAYVDVVAFFRNAARATKSIHG